MADVVRQIFTYIHTKKNILFNGPKVNSNVTSTQTVYDFRCSVGFTFPCTSLTHLV